MLAAQGDTYREALIAQAQRLGVADSVSFDAAYRTPEALTALMQAASVVVLPYDSRDQVTSGVLVDSIASGRPVVATAFPHAVELLGSGAGTVVGHDDPDALVAALRRLLTDPRVAGSMASEARDLAPAMAWPVVANAYLTLGQRLVARPFGSGMTITAPHPMFAHLLRMTDHRATFEHACLTEPRREHGYCTDDMARVLVVTTREPETHGVVNGLAGKALTFLNEAQSYDGACRNRMDASGRWTDKPTTDDHWGRMIWGLGTAAAHSDVSLVRRLAVIQFERAAQARSPHLRAMAFAAIGAAELVSVEPGHPEALRLLADYAASVPAVRGQPRLAVV